MSNTEERAGISSTLQIASLHCLRHTPPPPPPPSSPPLAAKIFLKRIFSIKSCVINYRNEETKRKGGLGLKDLNKVDEWRGRGMEGG